MLDQACKVWLLQGCNGRFVLQALSKRMNESRSKEMLSQDSRCESVDIIFNEALTMFYRFEKKRGFR